MAPNEDVTHRPDVEVQILTELIWVDNEYILPVIDFVRRKGFLDSTEYENPKETGEPFKAVEFWGFNGGAEAEVYYLDRKATKLADIRLLLPIDPSERDALLERFRPKSDSVSDILAATMDYKRFLCRRFIGLEK